MTSAGARRRLLTLVVILSNVLGNFALSVGMKTVHTAAATAPMWGYLKAMFNPLVLLGITLLVLWMVSRMALMSWADLSYILPITSIGYVLSALMGKFMLGEEISHLRWAGTLLIVAGMLVVSFTAPRTHEAPAGKR